MYNWYAKISVRIRWNVNLFYYDLLEMLASHEGGISISDETFNVFAYADDILLASTTASGLQKLINSAVCYLENNGLCFNPKKTNCTIVGKNPFVDVPKWYIHKHELLTKDKH